MSTTQPYNEIDSHVFGITVEDIHGQAIPIESLWSERLTLLFFMRNIGCGVCRRELQNLIRYADEFEAHKCDIAVIIMGDSELAQGFRKVANVPFPVYADPAQKIHEAFDIGRGSWWDIYGPRAFVEQLRPFLNGMPKQKGFGDPRRFGGIVVVAPDNTLVYHYVASPIYEYPAWEEVLDVVDKYRESVVGGQ